MATKGDARRDAILASARRVLIRDGGHGFRLRAVAAEAGIGISHVQYYFGSLEALLGVLVERYLAAWDERVTAHDGDLHALIDLVLDSQQEYEECRFLRELWAMSGHSPQANTALTVFYSAYVERVMQLIGTEAARTTAEGIVALVEGMSVLSGYGSDRGTSSDGRRRVHEIVDLIVRSDPLSTPK